MTGVAIRLLLFALSMSACSRAAQQQRTQTPAPRATADEALGALATQEATTMEDLDLKLAQLTLDLPKLEPYYHAAELPERSPLVVVGDGLGFDLGQLRKFGKPVVLKREADLINREAVFRFKRVERQGNSGQVEFEYTPEGLSGHASFTRRGNVWESSDVSLIEN